MFAINVQTAAVWYIGVRFSQKTIFARFITLPSDPMPVPDFQLMNEIFQMSIFRQAFGAAIILIVEKEKYNFFIFPKIPVCFFSA